MRISYGIEVAEENDPYVDAVESGLTLLAFYVTVYPPNYPQIGACRTRYVADAHPPPTKADVLADIRHACSRAGENTLEPPLHGARSTASGRRNRAAAADARKGCGRVRRLCPWLLRTRGRRGRAAGRDSRADSVA